MFDKATGTERWNCFNQQYGNKVTRLQYDADLDVHSASLLPRLLKVYGGPVLTELESIDLWRLPTYPSLVPAIFSSSVTSVDLHLQSYDLPFDHLLHSTSKEHSMYPDWRLGTWQATTIISFPLPVAFTT